MKLGLLLLKLLDLSFHFPHQYHIIHLSMLLDFLGQGFEFVVELLLICDNFIVFLTQLSELLFHLDHLFFKSAELALVVLETHFVLFKLPEQRFQTIFLHSCVLEGLLHFIVFYFHFSNFDLILF